MTAEALTDPKQTVVHQAVVENGQVTGTVEKLLTPLETQARLSYERSVNNNLPPAGKGVDLTTADEDQDVYLGGGNG